MKIKKLCKSSLSIILVLSILISSVPMMVFAQTEQEESTTQATQETKEATQETPEEDTQIVKVVKQSNGVERLYTPMDNSGLLAPVQSAKAGSRQEDELIQWDLFDDEQLVTISENALTGGIVYWMMNHKSNEIKYLTNRNGEQIAFTGAANYSTLKDTNYDLICDDCGYCINGCSDGTEKFYSQSDIATHEGDNYYNINGVLVAQDVTVTITKTDAQGDEITESYDTVEFESYIIDADGYCDKCGKAVCTASAHDYSDGICDICSGCSGNHTDKNNDNKCDVCSRCIKKEYCTDNAGDGVCDTCQNAVSTPCAQHTDTQQAVCGICGRCTAECKDEDGDTVCDSCGYCISTCTDETGANGKCDICGYCIEECKDENADNKCDICEQPYSHCSHMDKAGSTACTVCGKQHCLTMDISELQYALLIYSEIYAYLAEKDEKSEAYYATWLQGSFSDFLATGKNEAGNEYTGIGAYTDMRDKFDTVLLYNEAFADYMADYENVDISTVSSQDIVGTLVYNDNKPGIEYGNSLYGQLVSTQATSEIVTYCENYDKLPYAAAKAYMIYYPELETIKADLTDKVTAIAEQMLDDELAGLFSDYDSGVITIDNSNYGTYNQRVGAVEQVLLQYLYPDSYLTADYQTIANQIWNASKSLSQYTDLKDVRIIKYQLTELIKTQLKALKEVKFTDYQQITYDENGNSPYAVRDLMDSDIVIDETNAESFEVYDKDIQQVIRAIDGFAASEECTDLIMTLLRANGRELTVDDYDMDSKIGLYDFVLSFIGQKFLFRDDFINMIFETVYPTITGFLKELPEAMEKVGIERDKSNPGRFTVDAMDFFNISSTAKKILDALVSPNAMLTISVDGDKNTVRLRDLFYKNGLLLYPDQIATVLKKDDPNNAEAYAAFNGETEWENVLDKDGKLDIEWNIHSFDDFKDVLSVLFSTIKPLLTAIFSPPGASKALIDLNDLGTAFIWISAGILAFSNESELSAEISLEDINIYQNILVPVFEALGLADFGTTVGDESLNYRPKNILYSGNEGARALGEKSADAIIDPILAFVRQLTNHPVEKLLSILPNIMLFLESGKLFELFDMDTVYSVVVELDFHCDIDSMIESLKSVIKNKIFKKKIDYARPSKWIKFITTAATYVAFGGILKGLFSIIGDINLKNVIKLAAPYIKLGKYLKSPASKLIAKLPKLLEEMAGVLGFGISDTAKNIKWEPDVSAVNNTEIITKLNLSSLIDGYFLSNSAVNSLGFDLARFDTVIKFLLENLVDENGKPVHLINTELLDFETIAHLGQLGIKNGSIRNSKYSKRWNELNTGEYYYLTADTSDVFYYIISLVSGVLTDRQAVTNILKVIGLSYDDVATYVADLGDLFTENAGLQLQAVVKNATDKNGKLSLSLLLNNLTANNLICIITEFIQGRHVELEKMNYLESETVEDNDSHNETIPYLEYDNQWTSDMAGFIAEDIDSFVDDVLKAVPLDLDETTPEIETLRAFLTATIENLINNPDFITKLVKLLCKIYDEKNKMIFTIIEKATGIDISVWAKDFSYLFDGSDAPESRYFEKVTAKAVKTASPEKVVLEWYYEGSKVQTYQDILLCFGELLNPVTPILDLVFCGKDFKLLCYTDKDGENAATVTVKGENGYNYSILPLLEAILPQGSDILTPDDFAQAGTIKGLMKTLTLLIDRLFDIINGNQIIADLSYMAIQLMYSVSSDGLAVTTNNLLQPIFLIFDYLRPVIDIDLNEIINELLCKYTYRFCAYASANEMLTDMKNNNSGVDLSELDLKHVFALAGTLVTKRTDSEMKHLDISTPYYAAMNDIAYYAKEYPSAGYTLNESGEKTDTVIYKPDMSGRDCLTCLITMMIEIMYYGNNPEIIDDFVARLLDALNLTDDVVAALDSLGLDVDWAEFISKKGIVATLISLLYGIELRYSVDYNWAYILGEEATDEQKLSFLADVKTEGSITAADYQTEQIKADNEQYLSSYDLTSVNEDTLVYLTEKVGNMIDNLLNIPLQDGLLGDKLLALLGTDATAEQYTIADFARILLPALLSDKTIDSILAFVSDFLLSTPQPEEENLFTRLKPVVIRAADAIGINLSAYCIDKTKTSVSGNTVTYYNAAGEKTGLTRRTVNKDGDNFAEAVADILKPLDAALSWVMLGKTLEFFNNSGSIEGKNRRDSAITVEGLQTYEYIVLPLMEALGVKGLGASTEYDEANDIEGLMEDILSNCVGMIYHIFDADSSQVIIDRLFDIVPSVLYYLNSDAIGLMLDNTAGQLDTVLEIYNDFSGRTGDDRLTTAGLVKKFTGVETDTFRGVSLLDIMEMIPFTKTTADGCVKCHITVNDFTQRVLEQFTIGEIFFNTETKCSYETYSMRYLTSQDKAAAIVIIVSAVLDIIEDEDNADAFSCLVGEEIYQSVINMFNLKDFRFDMQDFSWLFTEYADTNHLITPFETTTLFDGDPYAGKLWTKEMAAELAKNLTQFIEDMLYLLGLEYNGTVIRDFNTLMYALVGGNIYSDDCLNLITSLLGKIKPLLDKYDPDGSIAGFLKRLLDLDLHAWDDYAAGGKYENGRDWGFKTEKLDKKSVTENSKIFEKALCELLSPLARVLTFVLCENDFTFFTDGDGLGKNSEKIQLTICGAQGYKYALVPLLEALNIDGTPDELVAGIRDGDIYNPEEFSQKAVKDNMYAIEGIVHPLVSKINDIMDSTATQLLELIPAAVYFINSNGIDTVAKNLLHSIYIIGRAIRPIGEQIDLLVYDEYGLNLYQTINLRKILDTVVYPALGTTTQEVTAIYAASGKEPVTVDGLEDFDFRLLFSIAMAAVNSVLAKNGIPFKFTSIAASAIEELSYGYVRSFDSLSERKAYTMVLGKEIDSYCYGDLISILMRIVLKFLSTDDNAKALVELLKLKFNIDDDAVLLKIIVEVIAQYTATLGAYEVAMLTIYYSVYGASQASANGVDVYDKTNQKYSQVISKLRNLNNPIASAIMNELLDFADTNTKNVIDSDGIAANGFFLFFMKIAEWIYAMIKFFKKI